MRKAGDIEKTLDRLICEKDYRTIVLRQDSRCVRGICSLHRGSLFGKNKKRACRTLGYICLVRLGHKVGQQQPQNKQ